MPLLTFACNSGVYDFAPYSKLFKLYIGQYPIAGTCVDYDQLFSLQNTQTSLYLSTQSTNPAHQSNAGMYDVDVLVLYRPQTRQIYCPYVDLCLDDLGQGYFPPTTVFKYPMAWKTCDSSSKSQQFDYFSDLYLTNKIISFTNPNNLNSFFLAVFPSDPTIYMANHPHFINSNAFQWNFIFACKPGR